LPAYQARFSQCVRLRRAQLDQGTLDLSVDRIEQITGAAVRYRRMPLSFACFELRLRQRLAACVSKESIDDAGDVL
jgi:hypothetical protein